MSLVLMSAETATTLSRITVALLGVAVVLAAFAITAVGLSTALYIHRSRAAIARRCQVAADMADEIARALEAATIEATTKEN